MADSYDRYDSEAGGGGFMMGLLTKDVEIDLSRTHLIRHLTEDTASELQLIYAQLEQRATETLLGSNIDTTNLTVERTVDARYSGQSFELPILIPNNISKNDCISLIRNQFNAVHKNFYGYDKPTEEIELSGCHKAQPQPSRPVGRCIISGHTRATLGDAS